MFNTAFDETLEDDQTQARARERDLLDEATNAIKTSADMPDDLGLRITAVQYNMRVWSFFLQDLASDENEMPNEVKASFISIGIFVLKHLQRMRIDRSLGFDPVIEINQTIANGLR